MSEKRTTPRYQVNMDAYVQNPRLAWTPDITRDREIEEMLRDTKGTAVNLYQSMGAEMQELVVKQRMLDGQEELLKESAGIFAAASYGSAFHLYVQNTGVSYRPVRLLEFHDRDNEFELRSRDAVRDDVKIALAHAADQARDLATSSFDRTIKLPDSARTNLGKILAKNAVNLSVVAAGIQGTHSSKEDAIRTQGESHDAVKELFDDALQIAADPTVRSRVTLAQVAHPNSPYRVYLETHKDKLSRENRALLLAAAEYARKDAIERYGSTTAA